MRHRSRTPHASRLRASGIPLDGIVGCILSNELFDAFPVHRFRIEEGQVEEMYVSIGPTATSAKNSSPPSTDRIAERLSALPRQLPDGFRGEVNLGLADWMNDAASALDRGYVLTIDYGYEAEELYSDARARGTFQTYYKHVDGSSPYQRIGRQDMTAHVDFSALIAEGLNAGLRPVFLTTQAEFLASLGFDAMLASLRESDLAHPVKTANLRAMTELVKPDGLGKFRVLTQEKNSGITSLLRPLTQSGTPRRTARAADDRESPALRRRLTGYGYGETEFDLRSHLMISKASRYRIVIPAIGGNPGAGRPRDCRSSTCRSRL